MTQLTDTYAYIKLISASTGQAIVDGAAVAPNHEAVIVRYVVVNDSNTPTGTFTVVGTLAKDGINIQPHPLPATQLKLQPKQVVTFEHTVAISALDNVAFVAKLLSDVGNFNVEESETNNKATASFGVIKPAR